MFTGIIEKVGVINKISKRENYLVLTILHRLPSAEITVGESISCDGACLTVTSLDEIEFSMEVSQETVARSICGNYRKDTHVNLERAVRLGDRLGGHIVTGHIDHTGSISQVEMIGESVRLTIGYPDEYDQLLVEKGSIAINGVSLTVNETAKGWCTVNLIPHTLENTNLKQLKVNDKVNLEFDLIGKYATKNAGLLNKNTLTFAKLKESGW